MGEDEASARTVIRDTELLSERCQFIVPSPMSAPLGQNKRGTFRPGLKITPARAGPWSPKWTLPRYDRSGLNQTRWHDTIDRLALIGRSPTDICASVIYMFALGELAATFVSCRRNSACLTGRIPRQW
jgi:hypothetical protein